MKHLKLISLAIAMLISNLSSGQEKDSINKKVKNQIPNLKISNVKIHCMSSVYKENQALWIVDGKITKETIIRKIEPNNIAAINIVKGNEAIKLYGVKGKNGVIIIKTKNLSKKELKMLSNNIAFQEQDSLNVRN